MPFKLPKLGLTSTQKNIMIGGMASAAVDAVIDHGLARAGALYAVSIKDEQGRWIWGLGTGDVANLAIGAGLTVYGSKKRNTKLKEMGFGWILAQVTTKIAELGSYVQALDPVWATEYVIGGKPKTASFMQTPSMFNQNSAPYGQSKYRITS